MQDILRMSQWKVAGPPTTQALPTSRTAPNRPATAARRDRKLAREAALLRGKSARKLSDSEVGRRLQAAGWQVTKADLQRASRAANVQSGSPHRKPQGEPAKSLGVSTRRMEKLVETLGITALSKSQTSHVLRCQAATC
jgi:hypothetical protein